MAGFPNNQNDAAGAIPVWIAPGTAGAGVTPTGGVVSEVTTGGTAVVAAIGPINGGFITNPATAAAQGVTLENLYVDVVGVPGGTDATANGTTLLLAAGDTFALPALAEGSDVRVNATSSGHKFTIVLW